MTSINFKVIGLTQPGLENDDVWIRTCDLGFFDLPEQEADALLIRPPRLVLWYLTKQSVFYTTYLTLAIHTMLARLCWNTDLANLVRSIAH